VLPKFAVCTVVSSTEAINVRHAAPQYDRLAVVPNAVDVSEYAGEFGPVEPDTMVFTGSATYAPNLDAARFLVDSVLPLVAEQAPTAQLRITGHIPRDAQRLLAQRPGVVLTGHVPDIRPVVARSAVSVAPIRSGGGTRLKILEAMALGTPVVATLKGAEGLDVRDGHNILLADDAQSFAAAVLHVMRTPTVRAQLAVRGRELVASRYDWTVIGSGLRGLVEAAA
jgi:glycosyltransferase involved in cell wall biosynthesis